MKNTFLLFGITGLAAIGLSSFALSQDKQEGQSKKTRHIQVTKILNGKTMNLDTVLHSDEVFVWNGDTLSPDKRIKGFSPSEFDKKHNPDGKQDRVRRIKIYEPTGENDGDSGNWEMESDDTLHISTGEEGDTGGKKIIIHKRHGEGDERDHFIYFNHNDGDHFPPMPPAPPVPHFRMMQGDNTRGMINLNDPNIISFKKKKISGDREKIEIIRKKSEASENMDFNFHMDEIIQVPEPPHAPMIEEDSLPGEKSRKEIRMERRMEEKINQETQKEVDTEETK